MKIYIIISFILGILFYYLIIKYNNKVNNVTITNTKGIALGNQFIVENWFFNGRNKITQGVFKNMDKKSKYTGSNIIQSGGGNPYLPTD